MLQFELLKKYKNIQRIKFQTAFKINKVHQAALLTYTTLIKYF